MRTGKTAQIRRANSHCTPTVFRKTPEFSKRFVYRYLAFWSCGCDSPFIWDSKEGDGFYLGLGSVENESVISLYAPMPGSFSSEDVFLPPQASRLSSTKSAPARRKKRRLKK